MIDDGKIINACLKGSQQAFAVLVDKYKSFVCSLAYCATGNFHISEDIAQDVFISVWKDLPTLKEQDKFKPWLAAVTRNAAQGYIRKEAARPRQSDIDIEQITSQPPAEDGQMSDLVWQTLEALPAEYREVLVLFYRHEKSAAQVAAMMEISPEAVRQRLSRGREMIRAEVERKLEIGLKNSAPGKKFTASVIAAISTIPIGSAITEASVMTAAVAQSLWAAAVSSVFSAAAIKIAVVLITAAVITAGIILAQTGKLNSPTTQIPPAFTTPVETQNLASLSSQNLASPAPTPTPAPSPEPVETSDTAPAPATTQEITEIPAAPNPAAFTPRGVLSGLITDIKTGEPVIDATVKLTQPSGLYETIHTDENGFYYFDKLKSYGACEIGVESNEYIGLKSRYRDTISVNVSENKQTIQNIQLEKACLLKIEAVDEGGMPVNGIKICVTDITLGKKQLNSEYIERFDGGTIITGGIRPSTSPCMVTIWHSDYAALYKTVVFDNPDVIECIEIVMEKGIDIEGRALYSDGLPVTGNGIDIEALYSSGLPISGFEITASPQWWNCDTGYPSQPINKDGSFILKHIKPGVHDIKIWTMSNAISRSIEESTRTLNGGDYLELNLSCKSPADTVKFSGKLIIEGDCDCSILMNGIGKTSFFSQNIYKVNENREMLFEVNNVEPCNYKIYFSGQKVEDAEIADLYIPADNFVYTLYCKPVATITGTVVDAKTQLPLNEFRVLTYQVETLDEKTDSSETAGNWVRYTQADNGRFQSELNQEGIYLFTIAANGYAPQRVEVDTLKTSSFTAQMSAGTVLTGKVINSKGEPVKNAKLIPFSSDGRYSYKRKKIFISETFAAVSGEDGSFVLKKLPLGEETIKISHSDYAEQVIDLDLSSAINDITITLDSGCTIEGFVYDNSGKPRAGFPLVVQDNASDYQDLGSSEISIKTDADGYYKLKNLPEQACFVKHPSSSETDGTTRNYILPVKEQLIRLDLGGNYFLHGRIFLNGLPLSNTPIAVADDSPFGLSLFLNNSQTQPDGSFCFSGIPQGKRKLFYRVADFQGKWAVAADFDTNGYDLNLGDICIEDESQ